MKFFLILFALLLSSVIFAKDLYYQVEENDQIGSILLSLGHRDLWSNDGKVNQFKRNEIKYPDKLWEGIFLKFPEESIVFKKNIVLLSDDNFKFVKKINTISQYHELLRQEGTSSENVEKAKLHQIESVNKRVSDKFKEKSDDRIKSKIKIRSKATASTKLIHSLNLYLGIGGFMASNKEEDRDVATSTLSGIQPMLQLKGIYSNDLFGSISLDLLSKKILNNQYNFPVNIDYRVQFVPKWNFSDSFKLALSHSTLRHSYIGKSSDQEIAYELKSNFIGIGLVVPRDNFWFEMYVEKAYSGETSSNELTIKANNGLRLDTELVYSFYNQWKILPGLNYYQLKDSISNYSLKVFEARLVMAFAVEL